MKKSNNIQAAIFDMDGVIIDNHTYHVKAWEVFCNRHAIHVDETSFRAKYFGKINSDILNGLMNEPLTVSQIDLLGEEKEAIYREIYKHDITPIKGLVPFLIKLKESGIKTAVATSAPTSNLDFTIDSLNIRHLFDAIVDASMITKGKPDPEIYLKAASLLEVNPDNSIVFEDSIAGIKSGQNAGMRVIALTTTHNIEELPNTEISINDFTEISVDRILIL
ncbi:MAG TPA: hypothetical protein DIW31_06335 [Bacteroidales bacterium]|nr:hypothetical protein [Bacteroidales bacterium]